MRAHALIFLSAIQLSVVSANGLGGHHAHLKRQAKSTSFRAIPLVFISNTLSNTSLYLPPTGSYSTSSGDWHRYTAFGEHHPGNGNQSRPAVYRHLFPRGYTTD